MWLTITVTGEEAEEIALTRERVRTMAASRLRAARLYMDGLSWRRDDDRTLASVWSGWLEVDIATYDQAFHITGAYNKLLRDPVTDLTRWASTWIVGGVGTHGGNAGFVMQTLSEHLDRFLLEYLRMNEDSCR